jgi:hypothetical protein
MLTEHDALDRVSMAANLQSDFVFIPRPYIVQYHAIVRVPNDNDIARLTRSNTRWTGTTLLCRCHHLTYHLASISVYWYITLSTLKRPHLHVGIELLYHLLLHEIINHKMAII